MRPGRKVDVAPQTLAGGENSGRKSPGSPPALTDGGPAPHACGAPRITPHTSSNRLRSGPRDEAARACRCGILTSDS